MNTHPTAYFFMACVIALTAISCAALQDDPDQQTITTASATSQPASETAVDSVVDTAWYRVRLSSLTNPEIYQEVDLQRNEPTDIPGMEIQLTALDYFPNYSYSFSERRPENLSDSPINPGLRMTMVTDSLVLPPFWLFQKRPQFRPFSRMPMNIIFLGKVEDGE